MSWYLFVGEWCAHRAAGSGSLLAFFFVFFVFVVFLGIFWGLLFLVKFSWLLHICVSCGEMLV